MDKGYIYKLSPVTDTRLFEDITAKDIFSALGGKEKIALSDLFADSFCRKPMSLEFSEYLDTPNKLIAFKKIKKARFISLELLNRLKGDKSLLPKTELLIMMFLCGEALLKDGMLFSATECPQYSVTTKIDPNLNRPYVTIIPKDTPLCFYADRENLCPDTLTLKGFPFRIVSVTEFENSGEREILQTDLVLNNVTHIKEGSCFKVGISEDLREKRLICGSVLLKDSELTVGTSYKPFVMRF